MSNWDATPWFVGGGAEHSPAVARLLAYAATSGTEGIVSPGDLKVIPLSPSSGGVRVSPGACLIRNHAATATAQETYIGRLPADDPVTISPTGVGAGRTDLIVAVIEDPFANSSYPEPEDPSDGSYIKTLVIPGVPANTTDPRKLPGYSNISAIPLARVTIPADTTSITASMITDLRKVAVELRETVLRTYALVTANTDTLKETTSYPNGGGTWPEAVETAWGQVPIPAWATRARIVMTWAGVRVPPGNAWGDVWVQVGPTANPNNRKTQAVAWDSPGVSQNSKTVMVAADDIAIPAALRGTSQVFYPRGNRVGGTASAAPILDGGSAMVLQIEFYGAAA